MFGRLLKTDPGRAIAVGVMLVGIGFVAILSGAIAQRFLAQDVREVEAEITELDVGEQDCFSRCAPEAS